MKALLNVLETRLRRRPVWLRPPGWLRPSGWLRASDTPGIRVTDSGFAVRELVVPWDEVSRIRARRGGPVDGDICLDIRADLDASTITLSEGQRGFDDFVAMADRKMTFPLGWWDHLDGAGTRRHGLTLFERFTHG